MISKNYCLESGIYSIQTVNDQIFLRGQATVGTANIQVTTRIQTSWMFISAILISINPENSICIGESLGQVELPRPDTNNSEEPDIDENGQRYENPTYLFYYLKRIIANYKTHNYLLITVSFMVIHLLQRKHVPCYSSENRITRELLVIS
jgi:hypothetical protein